MSTFHFELLRKVKRPPKRLLPVHRGLCAFCEHGLTNTLRHALGNLPTKALRSNLNPLVRVE